MSSIIRGEVVEGQGHTLRRRILNNDGSAITADDIDTITVTSYDLDSEELIDTSTLDPADVVVSLSTSNGWVADDTGYNLALTLAGSHWPEGGRTVRVEALITPVEGDAIYALWDVEVVNVIGG